ncbi:hypothetical protein RchiOBHm_Chr2g0130451 [Rosa chinensis]|uniref:Uncharacterized protein n=1 Tax=Rosa chinensis TaxID=74649 RepID=A0A2P6RUU4_ROSCH|nr:hypothetical protein RchiOBHm_Chr2g0130451 [Rosa chinensis]
MVSWLVDGAEVFRVNNYSGSVVLGGGQGLNFYSLGFSRNFLHKSCRARRYEFVDMWNMEIGVCTRKLWPLEEVSILV